MVRHPMYAGALFIFSERRPRSNRGGGSRRQVLLGRQTKALQKGWTWVACVRILFLWRWVRKMAIGGCGWGFGQARGDRGALWDAGAVSNIRRASCSAAIGWRRIRSSTICNFGCDAGSAIAGVNFGSPFSTSGVAAIVRSRDRSGWWWWRSDGALIIVRVVAEHGRLQVSPSHRVSY